MTDAPAPRHTNRLINETSPYLLQHAHNPVDWYPWGPEALARAKLLDRPIFLSIGYAACHWCHVMERESFENEEIAAQLNRDFVSIKVDREERPDLDDVYMAAVQAMTGSGGWPMSVFLTPDLEPFFGGTYFPPEDRHGLPGFPRVLAAVADAYRNRRADVTAQARQLAAHLREQLSVRPGSADPEERQLAVAVARLASTFDATHGGFGGAPKFPAPMTLEFLLRSWRRTGDANTLRMVTVTLDRMAAGGIHDQLGGGFARYSTDARWLVPHFEKMLYDNALLAHAYLEAFRATGEPRYAEVARDTLEFMLRELRTDEGGLASALDADSEGEEGRFYVWDHGRFMSALRQAGLGDDEVRALAAYWGLTEAGNWEGTNILHVANPAAASPELVARARGALLAARERRVRPGRDDKQVAAWNGLALRALATAALVLGDDGYAAAAADLVAFVRRGLLHDGDRLWRTSRDGRAHTPAFAEDYACVVDGLLAAYAALGRADDLLLAAALVDRLISDFWDEASGTLYDTGPEHERTVLRPRGLLDSATPAANSVAADVLLRLALLVGEEDHDRRARSILRAVAPALDRQPSAFGRMLCAADRALGAPVDAVIAGDPDDELARALRRAAAAPYAPDLVIAPLAPGTPISELPLFAGKDARDGRPTAYVCRGYACEEPTGDPGRVREQVAVLAGMGRGGSAGISREGS
ncbi:MAG TPA: thioredoxin domain-containing protein [candidate division Zixibacteria bacterium]|nr:thioredoxin domain-containing protein [candidate division Zixibacteria bacterium]